MKTAVHDRGGETPGARGGQARCSPLVSSVCEPDRLPDTRPEDAHPRTHSPRARERVSTGGPGDTEPSSTRATSRHERVTDTVRVDDEWERDL